MIQKFLQKYKTDKEKLLSNNTGYSIKNWFLYGVTLIGLALLIVVGFVLLVDVIEDKQVQTSISDLSTFVGAIAGLFVSAGLPKIVGEIFEYRSNKKKT